MRRMTMNLKDGAGSDLPSDIITLILLWLPVRSLCRLKCVGKSWLLLISSEDFVKNRINFNRSQKHLTERLMYNSRGFNCYSQDLESLDSPAVHYEFRGEQNAISFPWICNSCNGLILLLGFHHSFVLVNPSIGEYRKLPQFPFSIGSIWSVVQNIPGYGFGYNSSSDDYKVVVISSYGYKYNIEGVYNLVSVYSLRSNSWRKFTISPHRSFPVSRSKGVFINGVLHWPSMGNIVAFHLRTESFNTVPLPSSATKIHEVVMGDYLCGLECGAYLCGPLYFWVMKEYGVRNSWVKFTINFSFSSVDRVVPSRTGKILLFMGRKVGFYDLEEGSFEELIVRDIPYTGAVLYEESLISLK